VVTLKSSELYACRAASQASPTGGEHDSEKVRDHRGIKCHSIWITPTFRSASLLNVAGDMSAEEDPMSTKKQLYQ
jgi:hypothetical protein